ncbi:hypothetical protein AXG93_2886s1130 [Marchantia polymorpha subsp. ruderalis]|uniref:Uncharacterized protein n=1 Tax=Marchantia polymorpha subsp. ruderalis TaxID=1480154 RepID=A0A176WMT2_MARPO|nr:hypothetical protein AXG93_2886s1130 [Marchantia polymorpha subsp. ruderalis]
MWRVEEKGLHRCLEGNAERQEGEGLAGAHEKQFGPGERELHAADARDGICETVEFPTKEGRKEGETERRKQSAGGVDFGDVKFRSSKVSLPGLARGQAGPEPVNKTAPESQE